MDRRHALKTLLYGSAAAAAATTLSPAVAAIRPLQAERKYIGIAMVGIGGYARYCLPRLAQSRHAQLAAVVSADKAKALAVANDYALPADTIYNYQNFDQIAADDRIDAVHLCLPVGLHAEYTERALLAGKHVLCEKPLASNVAEAEKLIALAKQQQLLLMPAYRAFYSDAVKQALRKIPELGLLTTIDAHKGFNMQLPAGNWRFDPALAGGGALYDIGPYSLQLIRWAAGSLPIKVQAMFGPAGTDPRYRHVEPHTAWNMEFANGAIATGSASWRYHLQNHARFATEQGWILLDPATPGSGERLYLGQPAPMRVEELSIPMREQVPVMYDDFAQAILQQQEPAVTAADGLADLILIDALYQSAREGRTIILPQKSTASA